MTQLQPVRRALLSVSDKDGLLPLAEGLAKYGVELISTGGTAKMLRDAGLEVMDISDYTGFPEMMDGRVKTLHPKVHGGLLALRDKPDHADAMKAHEIGPIDLVVVNLYPFEATIARGAEYDECIENIDIGGPSMLRSAAKNHEYVTVLTDPADYDAFLEQLETQDGNTDYAFRQRCAAKAYARTACYDAAISQWFAKELEVPHPEQMALPAKRKQLLRYGENPHQQAAFYVTDPSVPGVASAEQLQGKELSFNNLHDTDAAFNLVAEFDAPAVAIIKHATPCGVAIADTVVDAYHKALESDPVSAFGGIIAANREIDGETAIAISELFAEVIIAPAFSREAKEIFSAKTNLRLLETHSMPSRDMALPMLKSVSGGFLLQDMDLAPITDSQLQLVTQAKPDARTLEDLRFAFSVVKHVKSNAIVIAKAGATVGMGGGQTSRVDAVRQAIWQANQRLEVEQPIAANGPTTRPTYVERARGAVLASDAFFPFADNIDLAREAGIAAIIQPGGSKRDDEVIKAADKAGIAMVFTGQRHFRH